jgi:hypothetical protein
MGMNSTIETCPIWLPTYMYTILRLIRDSFNPRMVVLCSVNNANGRVYKVTLYYVYYGEMEHIGSH